MEPIKITIKKILQKNTGSLKNNMPTITVPTAPMPVQTAYPVPMLIVCTALFKKKKLRDMLTKNPAPHHLLEKFFDN